MYLRINRNRLDTIFDLLKPVVPTRPLNPVEGQVRLMVDGAETLVADATDGRVQVRATTAVEDGDGMDLFPAHRLADFVGAMPKGDVTLAVDENRMAEIYCGDVHFTSPLIAAQDFPAFPPDDATLKSLVAVSAGDLAAALDRVNYAVGGEGAREDLRLVQISGVGPEASVRAYSGFRMQEIPLAATTRVDDETYEIVLTDYALQPLVRFLRTIRSFLPGKATDTPVEIFLSEEDGQPPKFVFATAHAQFAVPAPAVKPTDLSNILRIANEQAEDAGTIEADTGQLIRAVEAARLATPPDQMAVSIDLTSPVKVHAQIDDANTYSATLDGSSYDGDEEGRTVVASLDDLLGLLGAWTHERVRLLIAPSKYARGQTMPMIQTRDEDSDSPGIISQAS